MSFQSKLIALNELHTLVESLQNDNLKQSLMYELCSDIDGLINKHEILYHKTFNNKKTRRSFIHNINKERHQNIIQTQSTLKAFMPYILMYNLSHSQTSSDDTSNDTSSSILS